MTSASKLPEGVRGWRRETRTNLIAARVAAGNARRSEWGKEIERHLGALLQRRQPRVLGFYWPFKGEFDARHLVRELLAHCGTRAALPVVVTRGAPMVFRPWAPGSEMESGVLGIPIPKTAEALAPDLVLAPLVGFDAANYRLGYGGGYFDRTLAALSPRPFVIGVGFELSRLQSIFPQPHDVPMDIIVTEAGVQRR
ncbi:MAG: 5-formyltetrahydrofolate cyclo-ligase [Rhodospirillales bacterium]|nr:5-formyltetrahydrofolate cyclo-ligase [Rhodospirillales bacterium]